jgi:SulP family sulfate permease
MERTLHVGDAVSTYGWRGLRHDLVAGLTVAAVAVPQSMAYALIAGVPPQYALYTAFVCAILGSLLGSSRHLITGPTNAISLVVFSALATLGLPRPGDPDFNPTDLAQALCLLTLLVGTFQLIIALLKAGDLTHFVSESVMLGFMAGAGFLVALGQIPNLLGLTPQGTGQQHVIGRLFLTLRYGGTPQASAITVGLGTAALVVLLRRLGKRLGVTLPDLLLALVIAAVVATACGWHTPSEDLEVPWGLPPPLSHVALKLPWLQKMTGSALAIALLGLLESLAIAKSISSRTRQSLDFNRECVAQGLANVGGALFHCIPGAGSLTRSAINHQAGAVSRASGVISGLAVAASLLLFSRWSAFVPKPALAGILLVTAWRLVDRRRLLYCLRATRYDAGLALSTAFAAVFLSVEFSIVIGTFLSFLLFVPRAARLQSSELVVTPQRVLRERHPEDPRCTKMVLYSLEGELFFGVVPDLEEFFEVLRRRVDEGVRVIVLRVKRTRNPDMACLERLQAFLEEMQDRKVAVLLCGVREDFASALDNVRFQHWMSEEYVFLEDAALGSSTLKAVRRGYELLGEDLCAACPRRTARDSGDMGWYYQI